MDGLKKLIGAYLMVIAAIVAVFFIIDPLLVDSVDVLSIWSVVDVLMVIALALALIFNLARKGEECRHDSNGPVTRQLSRRQSGLLRHCRRYDTVSAQLVFSIGIRRRQPGGQPSGLAYLGGREYVAAIGLGCHRLPALARGIRLLAGT